MALWKLEYMWINVWCMLDWIIGFCHKTAEIHFLGISCSTFSLFTFHLENSTLSAHVQPSLENNSSNLLISIGVVIKITVYILSFLESKKNYEGGKNSLCAVGDIYIFFKVKTPAFESKLIYSIKFNFIKALFSVCILVYCALPTTN